MCIGMSIRYGPPGDLRWFEKLSRDDQISLLAYDRVTAKE